MWSTVTHVTIRVSLWLPVLGCFSKCLFWLCIYWSLCLQDDPAAKKKGDNRKVRWRLGCQLEVWINDLLQLDLQWRNIDIFFQGFRSWSPLDLLCNLPANPGFDIFASTMLGGYINIPAWTFNANNSSFPRNQGFLPHNRPYWVVTKGWRRLRGYMRWLNDWSWF